MVLYIEPQPGWRTTRRPLAVRWESQDALDWMAACCGRRLSGLCERQWVGAGAAARRAPALQQLGWLRLRLPASGWARPHGEARMPRARPQRRLLWCSGSLRAAPAASDSGPRSEGGSGGAPQKLPVVLAEAEPGCTLHLSLQLLCERAVHPDRFAALLSSLPDEPPPAAAEQVEALVLSSAAADAAALAPRQARWRQRLHELWALPTAEVQEMLAIRGLDYDAAGVDEGSDSEGDGTLGHALLVHRMLEYELELAADWEDDDHDEVEFDEWEWDSPTAAGADEPPVTWSLSRGDGAEELDESSFEAQVGVVRGAEVPGALEEAVALLVEEKLSDILIIVTATPIYHPAPKRLAEPRFRRKPRRTPAARICVLELRIPCRAPVLRRWRRAARSPSTWWSPPAARPSTSTPSRSSWRGCCEPKASRCW